jgi:lysyl-tRNA synthetase class 2
VGEIGKYHNPEFTLIEWYRREFTLTQMMQETVELICEIAMKHTSPGVRYITYDDFFLEVLGTPFSELSPTDIEQLAKDCGLQVNATIWLEQMNDFLFSYLVGTHMKRNTLTCLYYYPAKQAALAKLSEDNHSLAERFEVFFGELELANGYVELTDAEVQLGRFKLDQHIRQQDKKENIKIDVKLIEALKHGLPNCAGVALGFDRVLMLALGEDDIEKVMSFSWANA